MVAFFKSLFIHRFLIWNLTMSDIKSKYLGSLLGSLWIFILPLIQLIIIWFAFELGLRPGHIQGVPFMLWLITGMFPWTFFSDALSSASNVYIEKSFLVKKIVFNLEILPFVKILSSMILFLFLSLVMLIVFIFYGFEPNLYWLQIPYYFISLVFLVVSLSWLVSSLVVFSRDMSHVIGLGLQLGFWVTPIFWSPDFLPPSLKFVTFLNPVNYVVTGYRRALISKEWFWYYPYEALYFWTFVIAFMYFSLFAFRKLRPNFADVL
jgi:ABC-type polysaccharide/polyol phosphate export permease